MLIQSFQYIILVDIILHYKVFIVELVYIIFKLCFLLDFTKM
jgi:hypothetical protein